MNNLFIWVDLQLALPSVFKSPEETGYNSKRSAETLLQIYHYDMVRTRKTYFFFD